jgi:mannosyltransferase OCH1-like enzyme
MSQAGMVSGDDCARQKRVSTHTYQRPTVLVWPAGKSDVLRAAILYEHGGVYVDADTQWVNDHCLDDILDVACGTGFLAAMEPQQQYCANGVLAAVKRHPVTRMYMHMQRTLTSDGRKGDAWQTLGPLAVSAAMLISPAGMIR